MSTKHKPEGQGKKGGGAVSPEVGNTLQVLTASRLHKMLPALVLVYAAVSLKNFTFETDDNSMLAGLACATCLICMLAWVLQRHNRFTPRFVHPFAAFVGLLILAQSLLSFYLTSDVTQVAITVLVLLGGGVTLLSL